MRGRVDRLADVQPEDADRAAKEVSDNLASLPEGTVRGELLRRLAELQSGHPSAIADKRQRSGESGTDCRPYRAESDGSRSGPDRNGQTSWPDLDGRRNPADAADRTFWSDVGSLKELWQDHLTRWPDKQDVAEKPDRRDDPPGSWRGRGEQYLDPKENAEAEKQIDLLHKPEETVTTLLKDIELENPHGAVLVGLDHRLKSAERLKEKIVEKMSIKGLSSPTEAAETINDATRYTFCISKEDYVEAHVHIGRQLESTGYLKAYGRNHWLDDQGYKGINTRWTTPDGGKFELQFHTRESFYAKQELTHPPYRRLRQGTTTPAERVELMAYQREVGAAVPKPPGITQVEDYMVRRKDG